MDVSLIGLGNLGTAVSHLLSGNGHTIRAWEHNEKVVAAINETHMNPFYLPGIQLSPKVSATTDFESLVDTETLIITLPSYFVSQTLTRYSKLIPSKTALVNLSKGITEDSETVYQYLSRQFPENPLALLSGPSLANEMAQQKLTAVIAASANTALLDRIEQLFNNSWFSVQPSSDPVGVEMGGILKNIYTMALGIVDQHAAFGKNFYGAFVCLAMQELKALTLAAGGKPESADSLAGLGDLITTAFSEDSHNRKMGQLIAQGQTLEQIKDAMGILPEGYNSLIQGLRLAKSYGCRMPLANLIDQRVNGAIDNDEFMLAIAGLLKAES